ncbi:DUF3459 domain-containing protein [Prescottella sp. R16]|uniref:DUF3459 domain-containing protein n=1 Tax=Prescottella sp. R16 TaxID=3064529 RepID=UPI00272E2321|nr:DUF3459 domain-containing protein [Prescottella sp. R16]
MRTFDDAGPDTAWTGRQLPGHVLYALDIGTFTAAGTFDAATEHLDDLTDLGIGFVELAPVTDVDAGFAVAERYGGPDGMRRFVDACHQRGLAVSVTVAHEPDTALNLDGPGSHEVRRRVIDDVLRWFRDGGVDAVRVASAHTLADHGAIHLLEELSIDTHRLAAHLRRPLTLVADSALGDPKVITARAAGGYGFDALWADDVHHAVHAAVSGERQGYYGDFGSIQALAHTLTHGWFHGGGYSTFHGRNHGRPMDIRHIPADAMIAYTGCPQRTGSEAVLGDGQRAVEAALVLCSPFTPMLFAGDEAGLHDCYRRLIALRRDRADLTDPWLEHLRVEYDEDAHWIALVRGRLRIVGNLGPDRVTVPIGGEPILWWDEPHIDETASTVTVPGHSFVVLDTPPRAVAAASPERRAQ